MIAKNFSVCPKTTNKKLYYPLYEVVSYTIIYYGCMSLILLCLGGGNGIYSAAINTRCLIFPHSYYEAELRI